MKAQNNILVDALVAMARGHGYYLSKNECNTALASTEITDDIYQRLSTAWEALFPGATVKKLPLSVITKSQLPVWLVERDELYLLKRFDEVKGCWIATLPDAEEEEELSLDGHIVAFMPSFAPTLAEDEGGSATKIATRAIKLGLTAHKSVYMRVAVATLVINLLAVFGSLFAMQVYDRVVPNFAYETLFVLALGVGVAYCFDLLLKLVRLVLLEQTAQRIDRGVSKFLFSRVLALKLDRRPQKLGTLVAQVRDYEQVKAFFASGTLFVLADLPFLFFFIAVIAGINSSVALVPLAFIPVALLVGLLIQRPLAKIQQLRTDESSARHGLLVEAIDAAESVKANAAEEQILSRWDFFTEKLGLWNNRTKYLSSSAQFVSGFFQQISYVAILVVGVFQIEAGELTMGGLIACSILAGRTLGNITGITNLLVQWQSASYSLQILNQLLAGGSDIAEDREVTPHARTHDMEITELAYCYGQSEMPQLSVPGLSISAGERIVILGNNGSGKSTLLKLLSGVATPSTGTVTVGGVDLQQGRMGWLRDTIGYLPQRPRLFAGTLLENLTMGLAQPPEEELARVLEESGFDAVVATHPLGLHRPISEGGGGLSMGQQQLLVLTRLLLLKPKIWLLDEPTASLDSDTEQRISGLIKALPKDVTVIAVTHRHQLLEMAQRVLALQAGRLRADVPAEKARSIKQSKGAMASEDIAEGVPNG